MQPVDDELLILDQGSGVIHQLNQTAAVIWRNCVAGFSPEQMAKYLVDNYEIGEEAAARDVVHTLNQLSALNLVSIVD